MASVITISLVFLTLASLTMITAIKSPLSPGDDLVELAKRHATLGGTTVCLLFSNYGWADFAHNFLLQARDVANMSMDGFLVYAWDRKTCDYLPKAPDIHCHWEPNNAGKALEDSQRWNTEGYYRLINSRFAVALRLLKAGLNVFAMDTDAILLGNPLTYLDPTLDVQAQLEVPDCGYPDGCLNGGFWHIRSTPATILMLVGAMDLMRAHAFPDQDALDIQMHSSRATVPFGFFNSSLFPNGFTYFIQGLPQRTLAPHKTPVYIHANWIIGKAGKEWRMYSQGGWRLPGSKFAPKPGGRYITYRPKDEFFLHIAAELENVKSLLFLSRLVGRTAIIPSYRCWAGHPTHYCEWDTLFNFDNIDDAAFSYTGGMHWRNLTGPGMPPLTPVTADAFFGNMPAFDAAFGTEDTLVVEDIYKAPLSAFFEKIYLSSEMNYAWYNRTVTYSETIRNSFETTLSQLGGYPEGFHCIYVDVNQANHGSSVLRRTLGKHIKPGQPIYVVHADPRRPPPPALLGIISTWRIGLNYLAWNSLWTGFQLMEGHWALFFAQSQVCSRAKNIFIILPRPDLFARVVCQGGAGGQGGGVSPQCIHVTLPT
jgi:hypothetical protein